MKAKVKRLEELAKATGEPTVPFILWEDKDYVLINEKLLDLLKVDYSNYKQREGYFGDNLCREIPIEEDFYTKFKNREEPIMNKGAEVKIITISFVDNETPKD